MTRNGHPPRLYCVQSSNYCSSASSTAPLHVAPLAPALHLVVGCVQADVNWHRACLVLSTACYHVCARGRQSVSSVLRALGIAKRTRRGVHSTPGTRSTKRVARRTVPVLAVPSFDRKNRKNPAQRFGCFHTPPFLYRSSPHTGPGHGVEEPAPLRWGTKGAKYQPTRKLEFVALGSAGDAPALGDGLAEVAIHRRSLAVGTIHHATHAPECSKPRVLCTPQTV